MKSADLGRKKLILAAAAGLFRRTGVRRTTVADIAEEAQISVGSVYLEFAGKDAIVAALSRECFGQVLTEMREAVAAAPSPSDALHRALQIRSEALHRHSASAPFAKDLIDCGACGAVRDAVRGFERAEQALIQGLLEAGEKSGEFELVDRSDVVAGTLLRLLERLGPAHESDLSGRSLEREIGRAVELLVRSVRA
ncbi:MAG: helix-turn-helix domain-containing protein [Myxococcota bacterium]